MIKMAVIIGFGSTITGIDHVISANWTASVAPERLWVIGSQTPYATFSTGTQQGTITTYGSGNISLDLTPSAGCVEGTAKLDITITPSSCGGILSPVELHSLTSYTYSKQAKSPGQCTYSFQDYIGKIPEVNLQGIATGDWSGTGHGITGSSDMTGKEGNVQAGFPGTGRALDKFFGIVTAIGGADVGIDSLTNTVNTDEGAANCTIPWTPIWKL